MRFKSAKVTINYVKHPFESECSIFCVSFGSRYQLFSRIYSIYVLLKLAFG